MNSAAVIGRQLRQQQTTAGRTSGPLVPPSPHKGRPRTPSHQPHHQPLPSPPTASQPPNQSQPPKDQNKQQQKPKGLAKMRNCVSCRCIWLCFKALSGGVLLIAIGVGMTVFGFYADHFAVQEQLDEETNTTVAVVNEHLKLHIHNLTYVGPVFMGLGGMMIVAACVLIDAREDTDPRSARNRRPSDPEGHEQLLVADSAALGKTTTERCNGPLYDRPPKIMTIAEVVRQLPNGPNRPHVLPTRVPQLEEEGPSLEEEEVSQLEEEEEEVPPLSTSSVASPQPPLPRVAVRTKRRTSTFSFLSPLLDVPSPQDIQILDPDGCTPDAGCALEMDVFSVHRATAFKCPPQRLQLEPRYLASVESDGLSDSDAGTESSLPPGSFPPLPDRSRGYCSPCDTEEQELPLLGRCSPPSSPEYPIEPLLKRDSRTALRRFQLMRQVPRTLFDGPSSEGGSR